MRNCLLILAADIEQIEDRRPPNPDTDVIYLLSPQPHIVDCVMADFERRRYRRTFLLWTASEQQFWELHTACYANFMYSIAAAPKRAHR